VRSLADGLLYSPALRGARNRSRPLRRVVRSAAVASIAAAVVVPLVRRRLRIPAAVTTATVASAPLALAVLRPRTKARDAALFTLQMWAFTVVHELPYDDPEGLRRRLHVRYPIRADLVIGGGELPNIRLQRALSRPGHINPRDYFLTWVHWIWFIEPHLAMAWILLRHNERFPRSARQLAAAYDLGTLVYFLVPTAPPWWASEQSHTPGRVRRMMVEVGERFWGRAWPKMYDVLGGNPWAAMPSLHFATSLLAAILLAEAGKGEGVVGWSYALTLGFALIYLGEHYVIDLLAGAGLVALVRLGERHAEPLVARFNRALQRLERVANA
jgi:membrane-associated phospholipid phosphatase